MLSRKSYEASAVSIFDNPLASRFDENDALMYFDEVKVPWERVFVYKDPDLCRAQFHDTQGHAYQNYQAQIRLSVKIKFLVGLARRITEAIGTTEIPSVREQLGTLAAQASMLRHTKPRSCGIRPNDNKVGGCTTSSGADGTPISVGCRRARPLRLDQHVCREERNITDGRPSGQRIGISAENWVRSAK